MSRMLALITLLGISGCAIDNRSLPENFELYDEALPSNGRGAIEYQGTLETSSSDINDLFFLANGWICTTMGSLRYSEVQLDHRGNAKRLVQDGSSALGLFGDSTTTLRMTRNLNRSSPRLKMSVHHGCSKTTYVPCPTKEDPKKLCPETESFSILWNCAMSDLPAGPNDVVTQKCESSTGLLGLPLILGVSWEAFLANVEVHASIKYVSDRFLFDYNDCTADSGEPFYLHISQGVGGHVGENDFVLTVSIDGKPITQFPSRSGLYTLALAYCPPDDRETIEVNLTAIEDDVLWDDHYLPREGSVVVSRGESHEFKLYRKGWFSTSENIVRVESLRAE